MKPKNKRLLRREWNKRKVSLIFLIYVISIGFGIYYLYNYKVWLGTAWLIPAAVTAVLIFKRKIE